MNGVFTHGDHICSLHDTDEERVATAAAYVAEGLRRRERCLYVTTSPAAIEVFRVALRACGIDVPAAIDRGALIEATHAMAHLLDGEFDTERMLRFLNGALEDALNDGFAGLRTCGDMSWLLEEAPGSDQVVEYEALITQFFQNVRATGMCQYDRRKIAARFIDGSLRTHPLVVLEGRPRSNPFYETMAHAVPPVIVAGDVERKIDVLRRTEPRAAH